jgi:DNA repair protein RecN (Recombination protein N)
MINELIIQNFAIIDHLDLKFSKGLIVFTGETGAGKSIIIDAVQALLGGRTDATMVRLGAEFANIEASFSLDHPLRETIIHILEREDLWDASEYVTLGRQIRINGRSTARINGRSVNIGVLREIGENLVDVHGQSEHLSLLRVNQHINLLDSFANVATELQSYTTTYKTLHGIYKELSELQIVESEAARRIDMFNFQINEIESARLRADEEEALREERNRLANAEGLANLSQEALNLMDDGNPDTPAIIDLFGQVLKAVNNLVRLDPSQSPLEEQTQITFETLSDIAGTLRDYLEKIEFNPKRLYQVEERLNLIHNLKRKYGKGSAATIQDILDFAKEAHRQLDTITHASERIAELETEKHKLLNQLAAAGEGLSEKRKTAAIRLEKSVETELQHLNMERAVFHVSFSSQPDENGVLLKDGSRVAIYPHGLETVEFLVAPNPGEGLKPLVKIASGGETSRLMLAIKNVLASADQMPTLIFDEIDQGIGGRVGAIVGRKLWRLARQHQVLCVTHLPQLAAFGDLHLNVAKTIHGNRTLTQVKSLQGDGRVLELAQMMGSTSESTQQSVKDLLAEVHREIQEAAIG